MSAAGREIVIVGAGVAGLAVAAALARRGGRVRIVEQAGALSEAGAGVQISPNGGAVLRALGLGDLGDRAEGVVLRNGADGRAVMRMDLLRLRPGHDYRLVHRADLIAALQGAALSAGARLDLGVKVTSVDLAGARPAIVAGGERQDCEVLIGADGLHSQVRLALNGPAAPFFTGQVAWRGLVPGEPDAPTLAEVFTGPGRHLVSYPLRGGTLRNIVAVEERARWTEESWTLQGDPTALRRAFEAFDPRVRGWLDQIAAPSLWGLFRHEVAENWGRATARGAAFLLGDAAHPTLPFLAQGASLALEDAHVLAQMIGEGADLSVLPQAFGMARRARVLRAVAAANGAARAYHLREPLRGLAHFGLRAAGRIAPGLALSRLDWLYGHDVTATKR